MFREGYYGSDKQWWNKANKFSNISIIDNRFESMKILIIWKMLACRKNVKQEELDTLHEI